MTPKTNCKLGAVVLLLAAASGAVQAQTIDTAILGGVADPTGAVTPGVTVRTAAQFNILRANGTRDTTMALSFNGVSATTNRWAFVAMFPSLDAIQEFQVQTGNYTAEYGGNAGANVNVQLRSGTNSLPGSAYEFLRNDKLDARNFFRPQPFSKDALRRNQFGAVVAGPVVNPARNPVATIQNPVPRELYPSRPIYNMVSIEPGRKHFNPYLQNWNLQVSRQLGRNDALEVGYVGTKGTFLDSSQLNFHSPDPGTGDIQARRPYPEFARIRLLTTDGNSSYHALRARYDSLATRALHWEPARSAGSPAPQATTGRCRSV